MASCRCSTLRGVAIQLGGLGAINLERLLAISQQELEFALWYMRQRGWILTLDNGQIGITADGVDKLGSKDLDLADRPAPARVDARNAARPRATARERADRTTRLMRVTVH